MSKRIVVISDTQIPFHDRRAVKSLIGFIGDYQPDQLLHIGDLMDYPTPARWSKGTAEEFAKRMREHNEKGKQFLDQVRAVYEGPFGIHEGNHDLRPREYLTRYAPALAEYEGFFNFENLLDFEGFGIDLLPEFNKIAPGWVTTHGHRGGIRLNQNAGSTALGAAKKFMTSVVMGHTHRLGISSHTFGYGGDVTKTVTGMEVGNLMDMRQAHYLKGGTGNWQQGFGLLTLDGQHVKAETVPIHRGRFTVDGRVWEV
ncbi:RDF protein [Mycobacterium phage Microwolf]|uniref:Phosphoesterase n=13 Tax=Microwolfvirus TaxID=2942894 RepID=A0A345L1G7_9CAUD|nr:metallo-phosphoesterase [Mycobacterium phage Jobu08]YP_009617279.1 metallo-phosphoesterase [Mycobacterium phage Wonder]YP_009635733.1 metallo-phosphoesterase [Mycobacterium phage Microwolf]YP_010060099.1 metallo-phosphoesterase [Mycobacterium phage SoilDragon]YP_010060188.1 metallo-phosphoesterase [Mycobacterium phage Zetzy]ALA11687.1 metallophosphoesterase [Mycobacterium phage DaHudson]AMS01671.1 phosphoesterase [Mycobacterium phage Malinsilva]ANU79302.1 metallophosphoesterase [Mycobacte